MVDVRGHEPPTDGLAQAKLFPDGSAGAANLVTNDRFSLRFPGSNHLPLDFVGIVNRNRADVERAF